MNKSELKKEIRKTKTRTLQKVGWSSLMLICIEIIAWNINGMSIPLLIVLLATCAIEVSVSVISLKELAKEEKEIEK